MSKRTICDEKLSSRLHISLEEKVIRLGPKEKKYLVTIKNNIKKQIAVKFRTNHIEAYSVNPCALILPPGSFGEFVVYLIDGEHVEAGDKLILIFMPLKIDADVKTVDHDLIWLNSDNETHRKKTFWIESGNNEAIEKTSKLRRPNRFLKDYLNSRHSNINQVPKGNFKKYLFISAPFFCIFFCLFSYILLNIIAHKDETKPQNQCFQQPLQNIISSLKFNWWKDF